MTHLDNGPSRDIAVRLGFTAGQGALDENGTLWRWSGTDWIAASPGDAIFSPSRQSWFRWTGATLIPVPFEPGTLVRVSWYKDGVNWVNHLCVVREAEEGYWSHPGDPATLLIVESVSDPDAPAQLVPSFIVEMVIPADSAVAPRTTWGLS